MWTKVLFLASAFFIGTGVYMLVMPVVFYDNTPGVAMMGPYNSHFIRDAGLAFSISGAALFWGAKTSNQSVAIFGSSWPAAHAIFHIWIWLTRGAPFDEVALVNLVAIQLPAWLSLLASLRFTRR